MSGPETLIAQKTHEEKYRLEGESFRESVNRNASALKDDDEHYHILREILGDQRFLLAGRIALGAGNPSAVTMYNCFVSGPIEDSLVADEGCIMDRVKEAAATMRMGGGIGYDFSTLRPRGGHIEGLGNGKSSGPISFMEIFDAVCGTISSAGNRRGAQMGVLRVDHPDIEKFIHAKQDEVSLRRFNISVAVTDKFMEHLQSGKPFPLTFNGRVYKEIDPRELWEMMMRSTWDYAEPGVLFIDTINRMNNLWYCETISATNPCAEQPLPPYGACLLGSFNLVKYLRTGTSFQGDLIYFFDLDQFIRDIPHVVRAMDNVADRSKYPLPSQELEARRKRRMGIGVTGVANTLEILGKSYGSKDALKTLDHILRVLTNECYRASALLAKEKGSFPLFDSEKYLQGEFIKNLREDVKVLIQKYGIRNSHLTSIAPTGTISLCADNVSSGIEPVFAHKLKRTMQTFDGPIEVDLEDYAYRKYGVKGKTTSEVTVKEHLDTLLVASKWMDSSVSKTINTDGNCPWEDFKDIYLKAYEGGAKGCTTFNKDGQRGGILKEVKEETPKACYFDPETGKKSCDS